MIDAGNGSPPRRMRQRALLLGLMGLFVVPMLLAWWLVGHWRPAPGAHHGELLDPARPLAGFTFEPVAEGPGPDALEGHWTLLYLAPPEGCDSLCRETLHFMRQIRISLGKDMDRARTALMLAAPPDAVLARELEAGYAGMVRGIVGPGARGMLMEPFGAADTGGIYLLDPLGNLVMRYRPIPAGDVEGPRGVLEDLRRLLKLSRIG